MAEQKQKVGQETQEKVVKRKRGLSIQTKLIFSTVFLILFIILPFAALSIYSTNKLYEENAKNINKLRRENIQKNGLSNAKKVALSSKSAIIDNDFNFLNSLLKPIVKDDREIKYGMVFGLDGTVYSYSHQDEGKTAPETYDGFEVKRQLTSSFVTENQDGSEKLMELIIPVYLDANDDAESGDKKLPWGYVKFGYTLKYLEEELAAANEARIQEQKKTLLQSAVLAAAFLLIGVLVTILQSIRITSPIKKLGKTAEKIAAGDLKTRSDIKSRDEIGELSSTFNQMAHELEVLIQETADKAKMDKELEVVKAVQETLIPEDKLYKEKGISFTGFYQPADQCGGDFWNYMRLNDGKTLIMIADVTGHGTPAAMLTATAKSCCDTVFSVARNAISPGFLLEALNNAIWQSAKSKFFMTCFISIYDPATRKITYANAGHNFPILMKKHLLDEAEKTSDRKLRRQAATMLLKSGATLGYQSDTKYEEETLELENGDVCCWYTDGIIECINNEGKEYGERRLINQLGDHYTDDLQKLRDQLVTDAFGFYGETPRGDDITFVVARFN